MKILEQGVVKEWSIQVRCTGNGNGQAHRACNSLLEVGYADLLRTHGSVRPESAHVAIKCIVCGTLTNIPDGDVPREFWPELPRPFKIAVYERDFRDRDRAEYDDDLVQDRMHRRK